VVNANVILYLGDREEMEDARRYLIDTIKSGQESGSYQYYLHNMTLYYAVSRAFAHGAPSLREANEVIVEKILQTSNGDGSFGHELATACAVCSLAVSEYDNAARLEDAARHLARQQRPDGSWRRIAMFYGSGVYYGSEELTTALCLEALTHVSKGSLDGNRASN
jgi:prenyltransferase beta subunit